MPTCPDPGVELPIVALTDAVTGYGRQQILNGVTIKVHRGEVVALIGHNGAGKSTALKAAFGGLPLWRGHVDLDGERLADLTPRASLRRGIAFVPQGHRVFGSLTVREHLELAFTSTGAKAHESLGATLAPKRDRWRVHKEFPEIAVLIDRRAGTLSGGERQIVSLAMALAGNPRCLLLDEPTLGLAPRLAQRLLGAISGWVGEGRLGVLIVEQKVRQVLEIADRVIVLRNGEVSYMGPAVALRGNDELLRRVYL